MTEAIAPPYLKEKDMLGELIEWLGQQDGTKVVPYGFGKPRSYRGYYEDVAFEPAQNVTFAFMLENAKAALGSTFQGYKGGDYTMHEYTNCWIAEYGTSEGDKIGPTIKALWLATAA